MGGTTPEEGGDRVARMRKKGDLPTKVCERCGRPFAWRRKWARDWDAVRYCSDRCRREAAADRGRTSHDGSDADR